MTSKEALEKISWRYVNDPSFQEWCDTIKQDLERLEVLENNSNKVIKDSVKLINKNLELQQENQEFREKLNDSERDNDWLREHYGIYKKAIEILKNNLVIEFNDDLKFIHLKEDISQTCDYTIVDIDDQQEYEILKEVLENE